MTRILSAGQPTDVLVKGLVDVPGGRPTGPSGRRVLASVAVGFACLVVAWLLALAFGTGMTNALVLSGISGGSAVAAGAVGAVVLHRYRTRSIGIQLGTVALTGVAAVAAGTFAASRDMFLTSASARDMVVILFAAGTVGMLVSFNLARHLVESTRVLTEQASALEEIPHRVSRSTSGVAGVAPLDSVPKVRTRELDELRRRLDEVARQLADSESKRRALEASRRELVAWVSHDLRTPLAGLRSMAEALVDGIAGDPETTSRYHVTMLRQVDELSRLVDDLFELSRIQAGVLDLVVEPACLDDLLSDAVAMAMPIAKAKGVTIDGIVERPVGTVELATPEFLRVLRNLLDNAIRHTPPAGTVTVAAGRSDGRAFVSVSDACGGIPPDEIDRVFEMAFRGDTARSHTDGDGAGLGLAIAQGLIAAQNGAIDVCNEGEGCRFTVTVPLLQGA